MKHACFARPALLASLVWLVILLPGCGPADSPPAGSGGSLASLGWTPEADGVLFASPAGDSLGVVKAGSRWIVLDSLAIASEGHNRLWLQVRFQQRTGWVDSGREATELEPGQIATH